MWPKRQVSLLKKEIEAVLSSLSLEPGFYSLAKESLTRTKYGLDSLGASEKPWPLLLLTVCKAISGNYEHALPAAAALHMIKASAEIFDDVEDADSSESLSKRFGPALAINVATSFLILAESSIWRLKARGISDKMIMSVAETINSSLTSACIGQHLDLSTHGGKNVSENYYFKTLSMKSAFITICSCKVGAMLATDNKQIIKALADFGQNLGIASQIANDILGITQDVDIVKHKVTLPVIYALTKADDKTRESLLSSYVTQTTLKMDTELIKSLLFDAGAIHYATIKMEMYKQRASDILNKAEKMRVNIKQLQLFLK